MISDDSEDLHAIQSVTPGNGNALRWEINVRRTICTAQPSECVAQHYVNGSPTSELAPPNGSPHVPIAPAATRSPWRTTVCRMQTPWPYRTEPFAFFLSNSGNLSKIKRYKSNKINKIAGLVAHGEPRKMGKANLPKCGQNRYQLPGHLDWRSIGAVMKPIYGAQFSIAARQRNETST
jgi:hypothetical protein